jgi:hypothetical protein
MLSFCKHHSARISEVAGYGLESDLARPLETVKVFILFPRLMSG